jgi:hypothetical protein
VALDVGRLAENESDLVSVEVVQLGALGRDAGVVERYAGIVGVVSLLPEEVLAVLNDGDRLAVELAGVSPVGDDAIERGLGFGGWRDLLGYRL